MIRDAKAAGVYVFGGGIDEDVAPVLVHADGSVTSETSQIDGGFCVLEVAWLAEAELWAARIAASCRTPQELRAIWVRPGVLTRPEWRGRPLAHPSRAARPVKAGLSQKMWVGSASISARRVWISAVGGTPS